MSETHGQEDVHFHLPPMTPPSRTYSSPNSCPKFLCVSFLELTRQYLQASSVSSCIPQKLNQQSRPLLQTCQRVSRRLLSRLPNQKHIRLRWESPTVALKKKSKALEHADVRQEMVQKATHRTAGSACRLNRSDLVEESRIQLYFFLKTKGGSTAKYVTLSPKNETCCYI